MKLQVSMKVYKIQYKLIFWKIGFQLLSCSDPEFSIYLIDVGVQRRNSKSLKPPPQKAAKPQSHM